MAVSSDVARVVHTANGVATFFSYAPIDGATSTNLKVYLFNPTTGVLTLQVLGTDYTFGGGGVTFTTAPPNGRRVILFRVVDLLQPDIYKTNAPFPAVVTEKRFDEVVKGLQQINDVVQNRAIILPLGDAGFSTNTLPAVENRKGRVLYFNATTGDPEAALLADTVIVAPAWAVSFLSQTTAAAGLVSIGAVAKAGDTMTGLLTLSGAPTATLHAATKGYVDTEVGTRVAKAGDTMTGLLTLSGAPTAANHAATKAYVDTEVGTRVAKTGDTMTGLLTLSGAPTATNHAATKGYVDTEVGTRVAKTGDTMTGNLEINATDARVILRSASPSNRAIVYQTGANPRWAFYANSATESGGNAGSDLRLDRYSDTGSYINTPFQVARANGQITFDSPLPIVGPSASPTAANHLATKGYVDSTIAAGPYVLKAGDTMTGLLTLSGPPTAANHAATRAFVMTNAPPNLSSVHSNGWSGVFDLTTSYTVFFDMMLADNVFRILVNAWYAGGQTGAAGTQIDYQLRVQLLDASLNEIQANDIAYGRSITTSLFTTFFWQGGGSAVFDGITVPNTGWRLRFLGKKLVAAGPMNLYNYIGNAICLRREP